MPKTSWPLLATALALAAGWSQAQSPKEAAVPPYKNPKLAVEARVGDLLHRMTLEEKVSMLAGSGWMESQPVERLGIPAIKMADGPMGVRAWFGSSAVTNAATTPRIASTAFPAGLAMAATWDPDIIAQEGKVIGQEVKALGRDMILGPTVNIARQPLWGRNFEGYGEDPYLAVTTGYRLHQGRTGRRRHRQREAFRRQQSGIRTPPHRRKDRRAGPYTRSTSRRSRPPCRRRACGR